MNPPPSPIDPFADLHIASPHVSKTLTKLSTGVKRKETTPAAGGAVGGARCEVAPTKATPKLAMVVPRAVAARSLTPHELNKAARVKAAAATASSSNAKQPIEPSSESSSSVAPFPSSGASPPTDLLGDVRRLKEALATSDASLKELMSQNDDLSANLAAVKSDYGALEAEVASHRSARVAANCQVAELNAQVAAAREAAAASREAAAFHKEAAAASSTELMAVKAELQRATERAETASIHLGAEVERLRLELETARASGITATTSNSSALNAEISELKDFCEKLRRESSEHSRSREQEADAHASEVRQLSATLDEIRSSTACQLLEAQVLAEEASKATLELVRNHAEELNAAEMRHDEAVASSKKDMALLSSTLEDARLQLQQYQHQHRENGDCISEASSDCDVENDEDYGALVSSLSDVDALVAPGGLEAAAGEAVSGESAPFNDDTADVPQSIGERHRQLESLVSAHIDGRTRGGEEYTACDGPVAHSDTRAYEMVRLWEELAASRSEASAYRLALEHAMSAIAAEGLTGGGTESPSLPLSSSSSAAGVAKLSRARAASKAKAIAKALRSRAAKAVSSKVSKRRDTPTSSFAPPTSTTTTNP